MIDDTAIAHTILQQMGGGSRLQAMIGAHHFLAYENGVSFKFPDQKGPNYCKIQLNSLDLYDVEFGRIRGCAYTLIAEYDNVYADNLVSIFENTTNLLLSF